MEEIETWLKNEDADCIKDRYVIKNVNPHNILEKDARDFMKIVFVCS